MSAFPLFLSYLNVDTIVSGDSLAVSATPALATLWREVMAELGPHEEHGMAFGNGPHGDVVDANTNSFLDSSVVGTLGSGSDYTVFLDRLGIASLDFSFNKAAATYGVYHSIYDSFDWVDNFGGREGEKGSAFELMAFGAKIWGLLALRLADSEILPFDHQEQGEALERYCDTVAGREGGEALELTELREAVAKYVTAGAHLNGARLRDFASGKWCGEKPHGDKRNNDKEMAACLDSLNDRLALTERKFLSPEGLPGRPWFRHTLQAPGLYLGYAAEAFPGVQQALDDGDLVLAQEQVEVLVERVNEAVEFMTKE